MLDALIVLLSFYALTWTIKESELISVPRIWAMKKNVWIFKLLSCYFCTGFYSGLVIYLLHEDAWHFNFFFMWGLAGAAASLILSLITNRLATGNIN